MQDQIFRTLRIIFLAKLTSQIIFQFQLLFCLSVYKGDEKIKTFIWDLISPNTSGEANIISRNHSGLHNLVPRGRNAKGAFDLSVDYIRNENYLYKKHFSSFLLSFLYLYSLYLLLCLFHLELPYEFICPSKFICLSSAYFVLIYDLVTFYLQINISLVLVAVAF